MCTVLGRIRNFPQNDGPDVQLRVYGDEFYARYETLDGYTAIYDTDKDLYCFATMAGGHLVSSGAPIYKPVPRGLVRHLQEKKIVRNQKFNEKYKILRPAHSPPPGVSATLGRNNGLLPGTPLSNEARVKGLTVLVDFKDVKTQILPEEVDDLLNGDNFTAYGNTCSVKTYYKTMSSNRIEYTNTVVGPVTLEKNRAHYLDNPCMAEALDLALDQFGIDLARYDCKGRGVVDAVNFLYAGETLYQGWLWPHNHTMSYSRGQMRTHLYTIQSLGRRPVDMKIGTFCHEAGHLICRFPDLYDYGSRDGDSDASAGMGYFCLMASGSHLNHGRSPSPLSGYLRHLAGWVENEIPLDPPGSFQARQGDYNTIHKFPVAQRPNEYFLIENRSRLGFDQHCKSSGLAVYHCDTLGSNEWQGGTADKHYQCALIQADGARNLENNRNQGDEADLFKEKKGLVLARDTIPSSRAWGGVDSGLKLYDISPPGEVISFETGSPHEPEGRGETIIKESRPSLLIPDNTQEGIYDEICFIKSGIIGKIMVHLDITHTYTQDLVVALESPGGKILTLAEREAGSTGSIIETYDSNSLLAPLKSEAFKGIWKLHMADHAKHDTGRLNRWKIEIEPKPGKKVIKKEEKPNLSIPDKDAKGVISQITVTEEEKLDQATVHLELTHTYHGDLSVFLTPPSGRAIPLIPFNSLGSGQGVLRASFSTETEPLLAPLVNSSTKGDWILSVNDSWERDTGILIKWGLELEYGKS